MIRALRAALARPVSTPAFYGHVFHALVGDAILNGLPAVPFYVSAPALGALSLGHEFVDGDYRRDFWNGLADSLAFWPYALARRGELAAAVLAFVLYLFAAFMEGRGILKRQGATE